jgi:hypothetical protein
MHGNTTDTTCFHFSANADEKRMQARSLGSVKHSHGTVARCNHFTIGKADPLAAVLLDELVADGPILRFVLASIRMDLLSDFRRQTVGNAAHGMPRFADLQIATVVGG